MQYKGSGVTAGGGGQRDKVTECPRHFSPGNFCWPTGKRETRKKRKMEKKRRKILKGKVKSWKWKGYQLQNEERPPFFFSFFFLFFFFIFSPFFLFFFCFSLFQTTEICFRSAQMGISTGKKHFTPGKNEEKLLCPIWKIALLRLWQ